MSVCLRVGDRERRVCVQAAGDPAAPHRSHVRDRSVDSTCVARHRLRRHRPRTQRAYDAIPDMDVGPFFFTQPNPPITYLREMQTPVLQNPYFYMPFISHPIFPSSVRSAPSLLQFRRDLKTALFQSSSMVKNSL